MPDEGGRAWIVEPPAAGEVSFSLELGEGAELTSEQEAALGELIARLGSRDAEVAGFSEGCPKAMGCWGLKCGKVICSVLICDELGKALTASGGMTVMGTFGPA